MATLNQLTKTMHVDAQLRERCMSRARTDRANGNFYMMRKHVGDARFLTREILRYKKLIRALQLDAFN